MINEEININNAVMEFFLTRTRQECKKMDIFLLLVFMGGQKLKNTNDVLLNNKEEFFVLSNEKTWHI